MHIAMSAVSGCLGVWGVLQAGHAGPYPLVFRQARGGNLRADMHDLFVERSPACPHLLHSNNSAVWEVNRLDISRRTSVAGVMNAQDK